MKFKYPLVDNTITIEDHKAWAEWLLQDPLPRLTMGQLVKAYEEKWSNWLGRKYSVACNSGSSANLLMYDVLLQSGKLQNKKIIVPSAAWVTSIAPAIQLGFEPIMCESDQRNFGLDIDYLKQLLETHRPSTVILVHVLGVPAHMDEIMKLKEQYGFFLLEDTCAAMGSSYHGKKLGTFGDMASVSTYFGHQFSTVEGGFVSTDNEEFHRLAFMLRSHGWINGLSPDYREKILKEYAIEDIGTGFVFPLAGYNFRLTDDHAFIGLRQLDRMEWLIQRRFTNHRQYKNSLSQCFVSQEFDDHSVVCSIHFCALAQSYRERNYITKNLEANGIETRPFTSGNQGLQPYWFTKYGKFNQPIATRLYECGFFLPNYPALSTSDIEHISSVAINAALEFRKNQNNQLIDDDQIQKPFHDMMKSIETKLLIAKDKEFLKNINRVGQLLIQALKKGKKIVIVGNGGSAADAQHFAAELAGKFIYERSGLPAIALSTNSSITTAIANDFGYEYVFSRQLEGLANPGDVFIGISTSGNSENVIRAMKLAREKELHTVALLGKDGGQIKQFADISLVVPSFDTQNIQEAHITLVHILCGIVDEAFKK